MHKTKQKSVDESTDKDIVQNDEPVSKIGTDNQIANEVVPKGPSVISTRTLRRHEIVPRHISSAVHQLLSSVRERILGVEELFADIVLFGRVPSL